MTSHQKKTTKKLLSVTESVTYDRLNKIFESIVNEVPPKIDEGIMDWLRGSSNPTSGMTSQQKREYNYFIQNFVGNITGHVVRMKNSGVIKPAQSSTPAANPIADYLNNTYLPSYLKTRWSTMDSTIKDTIKTIAAEIGTNWDNTSKRNQSLTKLGGLCYNFFQVPGNQPANGQPAAPGGQPAAPSGQPAAPGGQPAGGQSVTDDSLFSPIERNWDRLTRQQKRTLKSRVAGLT